MGARVVPDKRTDARARALAAVRAPAASVARGEDEKFDARVDGSDARVRGAVGGVGGDVPERLGASRKFEGATARAAKRRRENDSGRRRTRLGG